MPLPILLAALAVILAASAATAQSGRPSHCISLVRDQPGWQVIPASLAFPRPASFAPLPQYTAEITYLDHSEFLIRSAGGTTAITDFNGRIGRADFVPDIVTMNHGHSNHWTPAPDPRIPHVLRGWSGDGRPVRAYLEEGDMLVRSVSTDLLNGYATEPNGNAIFVFELDGLCIGHLGHLHHEPTPEDYAAIGRLDVVMAAIDGGATLDLPTMIRTLGHFRASVVIPMHWFGRGTLETFLAGMAGDFAIDRRADNSLQLSLRTLPERPTVVVLQPQLLSDDN